MPKGSAELTNARREEIIAACRRLYETMSFKEITLKEIGQQTSFTRTSIYNYFETKEEIFLALFAQEYELFTEDLERLCRENESLSPDALASALSAALERRRGSAAGGRAGRQAVCRNAVQRTEEHVVFEPAAAHRRWIGKDLLCTGS